MLLKKYGNDITIMKRCMMYFRDRILKSLRIPKEYVSKEKHKTVT
jgi:hypothetical protein